MRRAVLAALLALGLVYVTVAAAGGRAGEWVLFDAPKGAWLGTVRDDAPFVVLEERDGWRRIRLEAWIAGPIAATGGTAPTVGSGPVQEAGQESLANVAPSAESGPAAGPGVVQGVLAPPLGTGGSAGAGVLVLLVRGSGALDDEHHKTGAECQTRLQKKDRAIESLQADVDRALNSSDNFREAASRNDQLKARLSLERRERLDLIRDCRARALGLFETAVLQRALSDGSGRFEFREVAVGRYQAVAFETTGDSPRSWSFAFEVAGGGTRVLDPLADGSPVPADWGLR